MENITCPKCRKKQFDADNVREYSLSRRDDSEEATKICNPCGNIEAFEDMPRE